MTLPCLAQNHVHRLRRAHVLGAGVTQSNHIDITYFPGATSGQVLDAVPSGEQTHRSAGGIPMKSVKPVVFVLFGFSLLVASLVWGQDTNLPTNTKESSASGYAMTGAEQTNQSSGETAEQQIKGLLGQLKQAILKSDTNFFDKYYADDYVAIHGNGNLTTKAEEIENFKSGATKYESIDVRELKIRTYGDTVVVNALASVNATFDGKPYIGDVRNTRVWVKQNGNWKIVVFQTTRVAPASQ